MDKDFMQYVYARIDKALLENEEYEKLRDDMAVASKDKESREYDGLSTQIAAKEQELCYIQGFNDAMQLIMKGAERNG